MKPALVACAALILGDVLTTAWGQRLGAVEGNPFVRHEIAAHGVGYWALHRGVTFGLLVGCLALADIVAPAALRPARWLVWGLDVALAGVVLSNLAVIAGL